MLLKITHKQGTKLIGFARNTRLAKDFSQMLNLRYFDTGVPFVLSERNPWTHLSFKIGKCSGVKSKLKRGLWEMRSCKQQNPDAAQ